MHTRIDSFKKLRDDATSKARPKHACSIAEQLPVCNTATIDTRFNEQFHAIDNVSSVNNYSVPSE